MGQEKELAMEPKSLVAPALMAETRQIVEPQKGTSQVVQRKAVSSPKA
jgi:hypothetical protein